MKRTVLWIIMFCTLQGKAQTVYQGKIDFQKKDQSAAVTEFPYSVSIVEEAIKDYMNRKGTKENSVKGFQVFKGVRLSILDTENSNLYFKAERKSRQEKEASIVYLFITKENESPLTRTTSDTYKLENAKLFLSDITPAIHAYHLESEILAQENAVKKMQKKYDELIEEQNDLEKKLKKLQYSIDENQKERQRRKDDLEKQQIILQTLKTKRKP